MKARWPMFRNTVSALILVVVGGCTSLEAPSTQISTATLPASAQLATGSVARAEYARQEMSKLRSAANCDRPHDKPPCIGHWTGAPRGGVLIQDQSVLNTFPPGATFKGFDQIVPNILILGAEHEEGSPQGTWKIIEFDNVTAGVGYSDDLKDWVVVAAAITSGWNWGGNYAPTVILETSTGIPIFTYALNPVNIPCRQYSGIPYFAWARLDPKFFSPTERVRIVWPSVEWDHCGSGETS